MNKYSIGIDISKNDFHACLSGIDLSQRVKILRTGTFKNKPDGFTDFIKWVKNTCKESTTPLVFLMEATGVYYEHCALYLFKNGFNVSVVLPNKAKKYVAALGIKTKNDKADSKALSRMGAEQCLELWQPMGAFFYELRSLTRYYQSIQESITAFNNQIEAIEHGMYQNRQITKGLNKIISHMEKQLEEIKEAINSHLSSDSEVAQKVKNICITKGLGPLTVAVILAETNGFTLFKNSRQLISYAGYDVVENQSGKRVGKTKISKKGNSRIRRALHMPALITVRYNVGSLKTFYERNVEKHGIKMKSYVAVQKKLLVLIYALWKKEEAFDDEYHLRNTTGEKEAAHSSQVSFGEA
jgi:transposase